MNDRFIAIAGFAALTSACSAKVCVDGEARACYCNTGRVGAQTCSAGAYDDCTCTRGFDAGPVVLVADGALLDVGRGVEDASMSACDAATPDATRER